MTLLGQVQLMLRPRFVEGQVLGAEDLAAEQEYLIAARRRHLLSGHTAGIVSGLELALSGGTVSVSPGLAVDGYGREILLTDTTPAPERSAGPSGTGDTGIFVQYRRAALQSGDPGHRRWAEHADVYRAPLPDAQPPAVDLTELPDDAADATWPVLLGVLKQDGASLDLEGRVYAHAIGTAVSDPGGSGRIGFGQARVMFVTSSSEAFLADPNGVLASHDVVAGGRVTARRNVDLRTAPPPTVASPWSIYHTVKPATAPPATDTSPAIEELRIELPAPPAGPNPAQRALSFGARSARGAFARTMSVLTDGTLVIAGNLMIEGRLATGPTQADASDPRLQQAVIDNWVHAAAAATAALEQLYTGGLALEKLQLSAAGEGKLTCAVIARNTGAVTLESVTVSADVSLQGSTAKPSGHSLAHSFKLEASASQTVTATVPTPGSGTVNVIVHATGKGLKGTTITAAELSASTEM